MKKIKYIIIAIFAIFLFSGEVGADSCYYSPILISKDGNNDLGNGQFHFENKFTVDNNTEENEYLRFIAANHYITDNISNDIIRDAAANVEKNILNKYEAYRPDEGDKDYIRYIEAKFDLGSDTINSTIYFKDYYPSWGHQNGAKNNLHVDFSFTGKKLNSCPEAITLGLDSSFFNGNQKLPRDGKSDVSPFNLDKVFYLRDYDYSFSNIISASNTSFDKDNFKIILFLEKTIGEKEDSTIEINKDKDRQDTKQLLNAIKCEFNSLSGGFSSDVSSEVKYILDDAMTIDEKGQARNIRGVYESVKNLTEEDAQKTVDAINNEETTMSDEHVRYLYGFIKNTKYFKQKDIASVKKSINDDKATIKNYQNSYGGVAACLATAYGTSEDEALQKYSDYNPDFDLMYIDPMGNLLDLLSEHAEQFYGAITETNAADAIKDECSKVYDTNAREKCEAEQLKKAVNNVDCSHLAASINNPENLNSSELLLKQEIDSLCSFKDSNCYLQMCNSAKKNISDKASDIINGNTENQIAAKKEIDGYYQKIIVNTHVDIKNFDCNFFDEDILKYLNGALNLIRIAGPILVIILTGMDAMKMIASSKEEEKNKFLNRLKIRLICVALLILVPTIIEFVLNLVNVQHCSTLK